MDRYQRKRMRKIFRKLEAAIPGLGNSSKSDKQAENAAAKWILGPEFAKISKHCPRAQGVRRLAQEHLNNKNRN